MVRIFGAAQVMMGQYSLMSGKRFHGVRSVKMFLHQLSSAEGVKWYAGPQYNCRRTVSRNFDTVLVVVI